MKRAAAFGAVLATAALLLAASVLGAQEETRVSPIEATFFPERFATEYEVLVAAAEGTAVTFEWSGADCGEFGQPDPEDRPNLFTWFHPHPPCDPTTEHADRTIVVEVSAGASVFRCTYQGAETGVGPPCTVQVVSTTPEETPAAGGAATEEPATAQTATATSPVVTTTPVLDDPRDAEGSGGLPLWLGLAAVPALGGAGYFAYTRTRPRRQVGNDWQSALYAEEAAQEQLMAEFHRLLGRVNAAWAAYRAAVDRFRTKYANALSGSTEMQGLLAEWAEVRGVAQKQDLAFAIVTLLWGGGSLGLRGLRWLRGRGAAQAGAAATDAATATEAAAGGVRLADEAETGRKFFDRYLDFISARTDAGMVALADEVGADLPALLERYGKEDAYIFLLEAVAKARGWVRMTPEAESVITRLLGNGHIQAAGRTLGSLEGVAQWEQDVARLTEWAQQPGFWERLAKAAGHTEEAGFLNASLRAEAGGQGFGIVHEYIELLYQPDDIAFLQKVVESGGDVAKLRQLMGPAQSTAMSTLSGSLAGVVASTPPSPLVLGAGARAAEARATDPVSQLGDLSNFTDQFGLTGKFHDSSLVGVWGSELWALISSPFETYQRHRFTYRAFEAQEAFMAAHTDELQAMSAAAEDARRALERMGQALRSSGIGEAGGGPLSRGVQGLRDALDGLRDAQQAGGPEWQHLHADDLAEREAHIAQKLAYVEGFQVALGQLAERLPLMEDWLTSLLRDPNGGMRSLFTMMDPELGVRLISAGAYLDGALASAYRGTSAAPAPSDAPPPQSPPPPGGPFDDFEAPESESELTDDEAERRFQEELERIERRNAELDAIPEDYAIDVDFSDFPPPDAPPGR